MTIQKVRNSMFDLQTFVGDSGLVIIGNIPTDKPNYILYMEINGKEKTLDAMVDTGNMLKEPITGTPVAVVERTSLYDLLPKEILNNTESILGGDSKNIPEDIKREYIPKLKIIPFASLGKQNGMLVGIKPEKIEIINEQTEENKNAIIGIYNKSLTKKGEYNALIGIELY